MIEVDVIRCLKAIDKIKKMTFVVESQNAPHPMNETFILIGTIQEYDVGMSSRNVKSVDGVWETNQTVQTEVTIAVQGIKSSGVDQLAREIKLILGTPPMRFLFAELGYTYVIDDNIIKLPVTLETDLYYKCQFKLSVKQNITTSFELGSIEAVDLTSNWIDAKEEDVVVKETIPENFK